MQLIAYRPARHGLLFKVTAQVRFVPVHEYSLSHRLAWPLLLITLQAHA